MIRANLALGASAISAVKLTDLNATVSGGTTATYSNAEVGKMYAFAGIMSSNSPGTPVGLDVTTADELLGIGWSSGINKPILYIGKATATTISITASYLPHIYEVEFE